MPGIPPQPPAPPPAAALVRQQPSGEVLVLQVAEMRLHRLQGDSLEPIASLPPVGCAPFQFAWDEARQRLAVLCPHGIQGHAPRPQELHILEGGRQPRSLRSPPLSFVWSLDFLGGNLEAAGGACRTRRCRSVAEEGPWRRAQLRRPQPGWLRLNESSGRWSLVRAIGAYRGWEELLPEKPDPMQKQSVMLSAFEVSPAVFARTASGKVWFLTGTGEEIELLSPRLEALARYPSPLPPPGRRTRPGWPLSDRQWEVFTRHLFAVTVVGETLYLLVDTDEAPQLLRLSPGGEVARQALPAGTACLPSGAVVGVGGPVLCQMAVRADSLLLSPPWQEYPLAEYMRPDAP